MHDQILIDSENPMLKNHRVYGKEVLPGLAYIDLLYQTFREKGFDYAGLELRNVSIHNPLVVGSDSGVMLEIRCLEGQGASWQISVKGREYVQGWATGAESLYVTAEMVRRGASAFDEHLDIDAIKKSARRTVGLDELYAQCRGQELVHTGFMKAEGTVYETEAGVLIDISLGQDALPSVEDVIFHPVLMDAAGIGSGVLLSSFLKEEQRLFLPLSFESFLGSEAVGKRCFAQVRSSSVRRKNELLFETMAFFNEAGDKVAELKHFASKLVRGAGSINPDRLEAPEPSAAHAVRTVRRNEMPGDASVAEAENFLRRLLAERLKKTIDQIGTDAGYYEMGLDSPGLLSIVKAIESRIGTILPPTLLFEFTTIAELAGYLVEHHAPHFEPARGQGQGTEQEPRCAEESRPDALSYTAAPRERVVCETSYLANGSGNGEEIAVIGMAGRYPGAENLREFWENLRDGKDSVGTVPESRWDRDRFEGIRSPSGKKISGWGGFLQSPDCFDPQFFRISPREAEMMDPQERLFLEVCWEAIEDAAYTPKTLVPARGPNKRRPVGVFVGVMHKDYALVGAEAVARGEVFPLSLNYAPIANRVSYFCNFHGPSMAVDTVCSSSLTALHLALESIRRGECEAALAGGVNLSLHPDKYLTYGIADMHSSDGRCHTFGRGGDGFVSAEGVGVVLLKPLHRAVLDRDHIYAVIKGSAVNHGGTVSGITVPSPVAQADVIVACLEKTGIDPRTIGYVEAHGTGTSLGDPIEIQGLVKAFRNYTQDRQFCSIGSVKSNIGHAESAAGISALHKTVLQLHHKTLVPSLHSEELNQYLDLEQSPFHVQQKTGDWTQLATENGVLHPRRAGVSSFGATGSNAHIILEEHLAPEPLAGRGAHSAAGNIVIVPLSARNPERLRVLAGNLLDFLSSAEPGPGPDLIDLAYSLQVGRESMEERVVFLAENISGLASQLKDFIDGKEHIDGCLRGQVGHNRENIVLLSSDQDSLELFRKWVAQGKAGKIAELWVKGFTVEWDLLYPEEKPRRISLPAYPFARERYWVPEGGQAKAGREIRGAAAFLHPLVHRNTSDLSRQRFSSTFNGSEFFLADHVIQGRRILPGAAYLEMAREAAALATGGREEQNIVIRLKNIAWVRPIAVDRDAVDVHIDLSPEENGEISYEVFTDSETENDDVVVHSQGRVSLSVLENAPVVDIAALRAECSDGTMSATEWYDAFAAIGAAYGPGHRGIEQVFRGQDRLLAKLSLPAAVSGTLDHFVLHPGLMDSALQASAGLTALSGTPRPALPFALDEMEIYGRCAPSLWASVRYSEGSGANDRVQKIDLDLCDDEGHVRVRMKGFSSRVLEGEVGAAGSIGTVLASPFWKEQAVPEEAAVPAYANRHVLLCAFRGISGEEVGSKIPGARCITLEPQGLEIGQRFEYCAVRAFEEVQAFLRDKPGGRVLVQAVVSAEEEDRLLAGLSGLFTTASQENPKLLGQVIEIEKGTTAQSLAETLQRDSRSPGDSRIRYEKGKRLVLDWKEEAPERESIPWKDNGVYLITGGAGGLGRIFAKEITGKVAKAVLILTGRTPLAEAKQAELRELEASGGRIEYHSLDVRDRSAVDELIRSIRAAHGKLDGIIHAAGVIRDNFIIKKTNEEVLEVLGPKVTGLVNLDHASRDEDLDFFILFSSLAGAIGNPGQADYSLANAFMDAYGEYRNALVAAQQRKGRTVSINWPLWKEGGMHMDEETEKVLSRTKGMIAMRTGSGVRALYQSLASGAHEVLVVEGDPELLRRTLFRSQSSARTGEAGTRQTDQGADGNRADGSPREKSERYLAGLLSSVIKLPASRIEADAPLEHYGIDSIMVMQMTNELEKNFGSLPKTLFFEYRSIRDLAGYFLDSYPDQIAGLLGIEEQQESSLSIPEEPVRRSSSGGAGKRARRRFAEMHIQSPDQKTMGVPDIAIIGISGRYPQADNLREFWKNLRDGKDCITEVPKERWDHSLYFDEDGNKPGTTRSKWGGFIDGVDLFDPMFFNISPREAETIDPQERLFLQCVYEAIEDAGYTRETLDVKGNVGVYAGVMWDEYQLYGAEQQVLGKRVAIPGITSSIANRLSYFCNFRGPSMAVNTMCSSSLTAIHLACRSLQQGECEVAIAGGVNVSIHPNKYLALGQGKFVSSTGRCESFGKGGDGYVPGEGVGAVLLKPLARAVSDGDHIYGVIKASAVNHGGKTNGFSVPNPHAQAEVIARALKQAGIPPRTISYIEAHGTGTSLGDPIEIAGLTRAFREETRDTGFCAIGSAKSNIGHCESAAGIAGVTKVLLQIKHGQLAPSLHAEVLNPNIDFSNSPFIVQRELAEWKRPVIDGRELPRRAGVSSFGAGGSNAHLVIEEYISPEQREPLAVSTGNPAMIVLSARNEDRLRERAKQLLATLQEHLYNDAVLVDMAYTLQIGREAMDERLGVIAASVHELEEKLRAYLEGREEIEDLYRGQVKRNKEAISAFASDEDTGKTIDAWIEKRKYSRLLDVWVKGLTVDWNKLHGNAKPRRISLPPYPFAKERCWAAPIDRRGRELGGGEEGISRLHPLLHRNTSDFTEQRFSSTFSGREFFLADHVMNGQKVMPLAALLELARAAIDRSAGNPENEESFIAMKDIVWAHPFAVNGQPAGLHIGLSQDANGDIAFEIYGKPDGNGSEPIMYGCGRAALHPNPGDSVLDIESIRRECSAAAIPSREVYDHSRSKGIEYGPAYRAIKEVHAGPGQALAKLTLPAPVADTERQFVLHPVMIDSAVQAGLRFAVDFAGTGGAGAQLTAYSLRELETLGHCTAEMWAWIRSSGAEGMQEVDIDLCDGGGAVRARLKGLKQDENGGNGPALPSPEATAKNTPAPAVQEPYEVMTFEEVWQEEALTVTDPAAMNMVVCFASDPDTQQAVLEAAELQGNVSRIIFLSQGESFKKISDRHYEIVADDGKTYEEAFKGIGEGNRAIDALLYLWPVEDGRWVKEPLAIVRILQAMNAAGIKSGRLVLAGLFADDLDRCHLDSWIGFERSLGLVLPQTQVAVVLGKKSGNGGREDAGTLIPRVWNEAATPKLRSCLYEEGKRFVCSARPTAASRSTTSVKPNGTYLITGGCGGLGFLFAEHFAGQHPVNLVLTGRTPLDDRKQARISALENLGSRVLYVQADVSDKAGMKEGLDRAKGLFGPLHGMIHAAGIMDDRNVLEKDLRKFQQVLDPKVAGTLVLHELLQGEHLDFLCYFSSSSGILGDFGSCDYAVGNRFQTAFGLYQSRLHMHGRVLVINWPLWRDGGMSPGEGENISLYLKTSGQRFLETAEGLALFGCLLSHDAVQHLVLAGQPSRVHRFLGLIEPQSSSDTVPAPASRKGRRGEMKGLSVEQCLEWDLKEFTSSVLKIPRDRLDRDENLADFGFDSVTLSQFAALLSEHFGIEITPAVFFGHSTIDKLVRYFMTEHHAALQGFYAEEAAPRQMRIAAPVDEPRRNGKSGPRRMKERFVQRGVPEPVAIIGMSGRFPQSRTVDEMWTILEQGRDVVTEIPTERFDWRHYYGDPLKEPGKIDGKWLGCIPEPGEFDPLFFEISPKEAEVMDPRQRLLLQEAWKALEDAGYGARQIASGRIGMFVGAEQGDYQLLLNGEGAITSNHNAILASRLAYFLNLSGPVLAIDTACSSGLVAAHQACVSLRNAECDTAIAAGVNLTLSAEAYRLMSQAGMLSKDGKSYVFDKRANGMVPGEAVAVVVLKRLSRAQADGDPIYAVIRGSGVNYDGKTNGITAPSGVAQTTLLKTVYEQHRINPETIEYIVTHGTGTRLGDPVEINALSDAFKPYTGKQGYCAITSAKTNFGHTFAASGLVSLISLVQAFRHETIPASLHCEQENDYINWKESPFYVNKANKPWPAEAGKSRIGAVSAYGMSGTNAHMVVESYAGGDRTSGPAPFHLLAFSAKTAEALRDKVRQMAVFLENSEINDQKLSSVSYTLLEGRHHFSHRCALVVQDREDARYLLKHFEGKEKLPNLFRGTVPRDFRGQKATERYVLDLLNRAGASRSNGAGYQEILLALADLYCQGYSADWDHLFGDKKPSRISLPTYPFSRERFWTPNNGTPGPVGGERSGKPILHPLLHENTSGLSGPQFSSIFTGKEFFLEDHVVKGQKVLPGVSYLEMVRAAVEKAAGAHAETGYQLKNIVWMRPLAVNGSQVSVRTGLYPEDNGEIAFEISSQQDNDSEPIVHSQGSVALMPAGATLNLDLAALREACADTNLTGNQCYEAFKALGLEYGPAYRGIENVHVGPAGLVAKVLLPSSVGNTLDQYILHPSILDSALQSSLGLMLRSRDSGGADLKPALPFALEELEVYDRCTPSMWAYVRSSEGSRAGDKVQKIDLDLCDEEGRVRLRMKGFSSRVLDGEQGSAGTVGRILVSPVWRERDVPREAVAPAYETRLVLFCGPGGTKAEEVERSIPEAVCVPLHPEEAAIDRRFEQCTVRAFEQVKSILADKPAGNVLIQIAVPADGEEKVLAGLSGLLMTAHQENPKLIGQVIAIENGIDAESLAEKLKDDSRSPRDSRIRYQDGKRQVLEWKEIEASETESIPWKDNGVYLITGGAGGLGMIFAKEIARKVKNAVLVLTGRTALAQAKQAELKELEASGGRIEYHSLDVRDRSAVDEQIRSIRAVYGKLDGIIHAAGVIRDNFIGKKTTEEVVEVMGPKVTGLVNLDQAGKDENLDFFILFSSIAGALGNPGQADYALANAFMDAYAEYRNGLVAANVRTGRTLSINWPLWKEGGMHIDEETGKMLARTTGMVPMRTATGINVLYDGFRSGTSRVMAGEGNVSRIKRKVLSLHAGAGEQAKPVLRTAIDAGGLLEKVRTALTHAVSRLLKVKIADIDPDSELSEYGFDSITLTQFANALNEEYKLELTPTVFFEHATIQKFAHYLAEEHRQEMAARFSLSSSASVPLQPVEMHEQEPEEPPISRSRRTRYAPTAIITASAPETVSPEPIAIIGMSGRFPMAGNLEEFWKNLAEGRDCISEIPKDRWDWRHYYGDPAKDVNKTNSKWGGFMEGIGDFDPLFFGISPREAELMDPQQRLLMMYVWNAIEDAGYAAQELSGTGTGIFVGTMDSGYHLLSARANMPIEGYSSTGMLPSVGPNRMSYFLDIHGPSEPIETACSSSLIAIHRAVNAIRDGSCVMAIAGGVNSLIMPEVQISFSKAGMLCEDGRCKTFSDRANGYVRGEGVGMLLLKKLKDAERDGDHIYGVIRATAENHGGRANSLTAPNPRAQADLLKTAYRKAGIDPRTVTYIEAHGTGTELGDPIEINGLKAAFKDLYRETGSPDCAGAHCGLGSVKTNIGHLELAAGIAGVIKVLLQLKHRALAKSLHCETVNPYIQLDGSPFYIVKETQEWKALTDGQGGVLPRRAGVSSFGFGGANAHIVIEEYIPRQRAAIPITEENPALIVLSARTEDRLKEQARHLLTAIRERPLTDADLADIAYTLQTGRDAMEERVGVIALSIKEIEAKLDKFVEGHEDVEDLYRNQARRNREALSTLSSDEEMQEAISKWIERRKYARLLDLWTKGLAVDWNRLYAGTKPRRVSLPTYPFVRERYWITTGTVGPPVLTACTQATAPNDHEKENGKLWREILVEVEEDRRREFLEVWLNEYITGLLKLGPTQQFDSRQPLVSMGFDSLMALQLSRQIEAQLRIDMSRMKLLGGESSADLAALLLFHLHSGETDGSPACAAGTGTSGGNHQNEDILEGVL